MANEIRMTVAGRVENGNFRDDFSFGQILIDQANPGRGGHVQAIGTSEEIIDFGDVSVEGLLVMRNIDETNYVTWGPDSTGMVGLGRMAPGKIAILQIEPGTVVKAQADTATCKIDVRLYEA